PRVADKAAVGTFTSHIQNMIDGVQGGFEYHMKIVYSHFPMKASVKGETFVIEKWESLEALKAHGASPHMAAYAAKTRDLLASRVIHVLSPG
ncbi:MAG: antibiotic biosynthesis monooxygenase, partial [Bryobacteraceae bacterium]